MKRRNFLLGSAGLVLSEGVAAFCPPRLAGSTGGPVCPTPQGGSLVDLTNQLSSGQWTDFADGAQSSFTQAALEWQSNFYHDAARGIVHLMGKPANANRSWQHQFFTIFTGSWTQVTSGINNWDYFGHIYGNNAIDESTGDLYQTVGHINTEDSKKAWRYRASSGSWDRRVPESGALTTDSMNDTSNGAAWHPNLYGPGDGGLVIDQQFETFYWRKSTDAVQEVGHGQNAFGRKEGIGIYWPAQDAVIVGGSTGDSLAMITPNSGGLPNRSTLPSPPITTSGQSAGGSNFGSLHVHPGNPNKLLLVETVGPRAWTTDNGSTWVQVSNHPFTHTPRVVCSLRAGLGCLWAIGNDGSNFSQIWKPAA